MSPAVITVFEAQPALALRAHELPTLKFIGVGR
jgi:hypothetical protein